MQRSTDRILTMHTGSLPRPDDLVTMVYARENGKLEDQAAFESRVKAVTQDGVRQQIALIFLDLVDQARVLGYAALTQPTIDTMRTGEEVFFSH